ncbi:hypothetical protein WA026_009893 [Henosepilachna vigintioctopunctata]|uniref:Insulin-like domain-containing protein n=1 Tax=Henosepilachna vigintioctopunctata TaxID=420089 RepID=A0AAW1TT60_9CUCU
MVAAKLFIILTVLCTLVANGFSGESRLKKIHFCGTHLVNSMSLVCNKHYHSRNTKKSGNYNQEFLDDNSIPEYFGNENQNALLPLHFFDRSFEDDINSYVPVHSSRRVKKGIYEECCENPCTIDDLRAYCY